MYPVIDICDATDCSLSFATGWVRFPAGDRVEVACGLGGSFHRVLSSTTCNWLAAPQPQYDNKVTMNKIVNPIAG